MAWQARDMKEVIANRKEFRAKTILRDKHRKNKFDVEDYQQIKPQIFKKSQFTIEDKEEIVKYIQSKCRIYFHQLFSINQFELIVIKQETVVQEIYDPLIKSYYLINGKMAIYYLTSLITQNVNQQKDESNSILINSQSGIGWVFGNQDYNQATICVQSGIILQINHKNPSSFDLIEKNCLMTNRQRQLSIKKFKIFSSIQNFNKFHLPYFMTKKYTKGQYIYMINDESKDIYLVIEGIIAFQSLVNRQYLQQQINIKRGPLFLNRNRKNKLLLITQTVCKNNYFGQEQVIANTDRRQNAKCASIECLVLIVPQDKLQRLLTFPQFRRNLQHSAQLKQKARQNQISLSLTVNNHKKSQSQLIKPQNQQTFQRIKSVIFNQLSNIQQKNQIRSKYSKQKRKIIHNQSVSIPHESKNKQKTTNFSMLNVNKSMYQKTLLRFRYNLKQIQKAARPKQKSFQNRGRSLQQIWKTLKLQKSFNPEQQRIVLQEDDGLTYYNSHQRLSKQIRISRSFRPKSLIYTNKLKTQYIQYLQMIL